MSDAVLRLGSPVAKAADRIVTIERPTGYPTQTPFCIRCCYNLTGLTSARCPECGWNIDWTRAYENEEEQRAGTPAHSASGWDRIPAACKTVALLLFRPIEFARRLRYDERLLPALGIALAACLITVGLVCRDPNVGYDDAWWLLVYGSGCIVCILVNGLFFATICRGRYPALNWRQCFRLFLLVSLYSTCFVATWTIVEGPPVLEELERSNFMWPLDGFLANVVTPPSNPAYWGRTLIFYWWAAILVIFAFVRVRPRWRAVLFILAPALSNLAAVKVGTWVYLAT